MAILQRTETFSAANTLLLCAPTHLTEEHCPNKLVPTSGDDCPYVPLAASDNSSVSAQTACEPGSLTFVFEASSHFSATMGAKKLLRLRQEIQEDDKSFIWYANYENIESNDSRAAHYYLQRYI